MRRGYVQIPFEVLGELLKLPEGCVVKDVRWSTKTPFSCDFEVLLEGPGLPEVREGDVTPRVDINHHVEHIPIVTFTGFS